MYTYYYVVFSLRLFFYFILLLLKSRRLLNAACRPRFDFMRLQIYTTVPSLYVVRVPEFRDSGIPIGRYTCYYLIKIKIKTTRVKYYYTHIILYIDK